MKWLTDRNGRRVRLTDERRAHVLDHPEMTDLEAEIEAALRSPERVVRSRSDPDVELVHRPVRGTAVGDKWLCVVVKFLVDDAFLVTAYLTDQPKKGEILWLSG